MNVCLKKKIVKWVVLLLATPFLLFVLLLALLYVPFIQNWAVGYATRYVSQATGMDVSVSRVTLTFPLDLTLKEVAVYRAEEDTLAYIGGLRTELAVWPLLRSQVEVTGIELTDVQADTDTLLPALNLKGELGTLYVKTGQLNWDSGAIDVRQFLLQDASLSLTLYPDDTPSDTVSSSVPWSIVLDEACLQRVDFRLQIPSDTLSLSLGWKDTRIEDVAVDLPTSSYGVGFWKLIDGYAVYDVGMPFVSSAFNPNHLALDDFYFQFDSLSYAGRNGSAVIRQLTFSERSGLTLCRTEGRMQMDSLGINLPSLYLETSDSQIQTSGYWDWESLQSGGNHYSHLLTYGEIGRNDMLTFLSPYVSKSFVQIYPEVPLEFRVGIVGSKDELFLNTFQLTMDSVLVCKGRGEVQQLSDSLSREGSFRLQMQTHDLDFLTFLADSADRGAWAIPHDLQLNATMEIDGPLCAANVALTEPEGVLSLQADYNQLDERYTLKARIDSLPLHRFLPQDSLRYLTAHARLRGKGTDIYAASTRFLGEIGIDRLEYGSSFLDSLLLKAALQRHQVRLSLDSHNALLQLQVRLNGLLRRDTVVADLSVDMPEANLHALQLTSSPVQLSLHLQADASSNWRDAYALKGGLTRLGLKTEKEKYAPKDLLFNALTNRTTTAARLEAGDLDLSLSANGEGKVVWEQVDNFVQTFWKQLGGRSVSLNEVTGLLPELNMRLTAGEDNPVCNYLRFAGDVQFQDIDVGVALSPVTGIQADAYVYRLATDSLELDTIRLAIRQDTAAIHYHTTVSNAPTDSKPVFTAILSGQLASSGGDALLRFYDDKHRLGLELGAAAALQSNGLLLSLIPEQPTVAFRPFFLNDSNYVALSDSGQVTANVALLDKDGTGLRFYSSPNEEALQDLTLDLARLHIDEILKILPYAPDLAGILDAELHYVRTPENNTFSGTLQVEELAYEQYPMGTLGMEAVYLPTSARQHLVALQLLQDGKEVAAVQGSYADRPEGGILDADLQLERFPLKLANAFLPRELATVSGMMGGELTVAGAIESPRMNGEVRFDSVQLHSSLYALDLHLDKTPLRMEENRLLFDNFNIYARGKNPFTLSGHVDMTDFSRMTADLRMRAVEYELLNAKGHKNSLLFGKVFVSLFSTIKGELSAPVVRGTMNVLGNTDVTYILKDSPLTVEDRLGSMVTFVDFSDTLSLPDVKSEVVLGGLDLLMNVQIDQGAQARVDLGDDNYVEVEGGGNLSLQYTPQSDFLLTGRYTLTDGEMKYSLPVIPLKTFNISNGSYVEFMGDPANPYLHVTATERVRTSVTEDNASRYVNFDVGVSITNTLDQMGLEFTLQAPEDVSLQNQLAAMSAEERGKLAVTMLVTGMYAGSQGGTSGGFNTNNALNSFLQSEISNIAGSALKTVDVSIGVEDNYASDGTSRGGTDYSFRFAKRFWNNRLSVIIGGRISTGNEAVAEENNSFIDDISLEWRLDDSGTRYVKLFHTKNYESILEGEIIETGVGLVLRRKVNNLGELFIFRKQRQTPLPVNGALPKKNAPNSPSSSLISPQKEE